MSKTKVEKSSVKVTEGVGEITIELVIRNQTDLNSFRNRMEVAHSDLENVMRDEYMKTDDYYCDEIWSEFHDFRKDYFSPRLEVGDMVTNIINRSKGVVIHVEDDLLKVMCTNKGCSVYRKGNVMESAISDWRID